MSSLNSRLRCFMTSQKTVCILALTGAGLSTESGIPDYRSPDGSYSKGHKPILHSEFVNDTYKRKRYWARSTIGYAWFDAAEPNIGHHALRDLEKEHRIHYSYAECRFTSLQSWQ